MPKKFNPGHYWMNHSAERNDTTEIKPAAYESGFTGIMVDIPWSEFEVGNNSFDFSVAQAYIDWGVTNSKQVMFMFMDRDFGVRSAGNRAVPQYIKNLGGVIDYPSGNGSTAAVWRPDICGYKIRALNAFAAEFDSHANFEMMILPESGLGSISEKNTADFTRAGYTAQLRRIHNEVNSSYANTILVHYLHNALERPLIDTLTDFAIQFRDLGLGGMGRPDMPPWDTTGVEPWEVWPLFKDDIVLVSGGDTSNYQQPDSYYYTDMADLCEQRLAHDRSLGCQYMLWNHYFRSKVVSGEPYTSDFVSAYTALVNNPANAPITTMPSNIGGTGGGGGGGGGATGDTTIRVFDVTSPTNTTPINLTDTDILDTPNAGIVFYGGPSGADARMGGGFIASSTQYSAHLRSRDAQSTSAAAVKPSATNLVEVLNKGALSTTHEAVGALITGGLQITKSTTPTEAANIIAMVFAGADVQSDVHLISPSASLNGTVSKTGLSFEPNLLFFLNVRKDFTDGTARTQAQWNIGIATATANQYSYSLYDIHNVTPTQVKARLSDDRVLDSLADALYIELTAINSDGYTLTTRGAATNFNEIAVLAMRIESGVFLDLITMPTSVSTPSVSIGFGAQAAMIIATQITTLNSDITSTDAGEVSIGMIDEDGYRAQSISIKDAAATTDTATQNSDAFVWLPDSSGSASVVATATFGASTIDFNYTAVNAASYALLLAFEYVQQSGRIKKKSIRQPLRFGLQVGI